MVAETKLYDALGIKPSANQQEIKKAYRYVRDNKIPPLHTHSIFIISTATPSLSNGEQKTNSQTVQWP